MASASVSLFPSLKWAQQQSYVLLTVELQDAKNVKLQLPKDGNVFSFSCDVPNVESGVEGALKHYACEFTLFKPVSPEESNFVVRPRQIEVRLKKKPNDEGDDVFWSRLTYDKTRNPSIAIDWARWKDENDAEDEDGMDPGNFGMGGGGDMDFSEMMQQLAVNRGSNEDEDEDGAPTPAFGSADGQGAAEEEDDLPPLEEDD